MINRLKTLRKEWADSTSVAGVKFLHFIRKYKKKQDFYIVNYLAISF